MSSKTNEERDVHNIVRLDESLADVMEYADDLGLRSIVGIASMLRGCIRQPPEQAAEVLRQLVESYAPIAERLCEELRSNGQ